jgi:hypothetical protein
MPNDGCPRCQTVLAELEALRADYTVLERMLRVDSAIARQLSASVAENGRLRAQIIELQTKRCDK